MATFTGVFERKEVKYRLGACQYQAILRALEGRMGIDAFGLTRITSRYFDTSERMLIERSLDKPLYKEKLRVRRYGLQDADDRVFVEIKKKYRGIVYKRRVGCSSAAARAYLRGMSYEDACVCYPLADPTMAAESVAPRSIQIAREIDQFMLRYQPLLPSMLIACDRTAYAPLSTLGEAAAEAANDTPDELRITFDANISYCDLLTVSGVCGVEAAGMRAPLLAAGEVVMEIKSIGPYPLWLVHALDACRAYPSSFSKYGEAYRACAHTQPENVLPRTAERFMPTASTYQPRQYRAPRHAVKKGGRCA